MPSIKQTLFTLALTLTLLACARIDATPTVMLTPVLSDTPPTDALTPTATITLSPTQTSIPPTEAPTALPDLIPADFLFGVDTSDCELPCWMGLEIGLSTRDDVYSFLDTAFGYDGYRPPPPEHILEDLPDSLDAISHGWWIEEEGENGGSFGWTAYFDRKSDKLEGLSFGWLGNNRFQPHMTLERIIRELGQPAYMFIDVSLGGSGGVDHANVETIMIYENGMLFDHFETVPVIDQAQESDGTIVTVAANLCLGDNNSSSTGGVDIIAPISNRLESLSPLQDYIIGLGMAVAHIPIEEITDKSLNEIVRLATQVDNACIRLDLERFGQ